MLEGRTVAIDSVSESPARNSGCDAVVLVDVICDATTLVTGVAQGRETFPMASASAALSLGRRLDEPLLAVEEEDAWRPGFELPNSPARLAELEGTRPLVAACTTGAILAAHRSCWPDVYLACFRNLTATARHLASKYRRVLLLDAAHDGDVRCEDQMAAARIARRLVAAGFAPEGLGARERIERWASAEIALASWGRSAEELRSRRRQADLDFVLSHVDDLDVVCASLDGRLEKVMPEATLAELPIGA